MTLLARGFHKKFDIFNSKGSFNEKFPILLTCNGITNASINVLVNVLNLVSTALCRRQIRVRAVPISLEAPAKRKKSKKSINIRVM